MKPVVGTLRQQLRAVAYNCSVFDYEAFARWIKTKDAATQELAERVPPNQLYEYRSTAASVPVFCYVEAYSPPHAVVIIVPVGGSLFATAEQLQPLNLASNKL